MQKNFKIFEIYNVSARTRRVVQCGHFSEKEGVNFLRFFADVFYGRLLTTFISYGISTWIYVVDCPRDQVWWEPATF